MQQSPKAGLVSLRVRFRTGGLQTPLANGSTQKFIAKRYHKTDAKLHNWLKKNGLKAAKSSIPL
ncbi:hypothetical protein NSMM_730011 [Nitrosomonas mobilis]|uniref:Uncharacterized protein n=1 Tax=Nitrosomonas mobilis TaxID=51642 RepID=A0A1G5SJP6_9PROT|nr:hypothetical protein NSMM_730011 [Nitrosomonas mobilis]